MILLVLQQMFSIWATAATKCNMTSWYIWSKDMTLKDQYYYADTVLLWRSSYSEYLNIAILNNIVNVKLRLFVTPACLNYWMNDCETLHSCCPSMKKNIRYLLSRRNAWIGTNRRNLVKYKCIIKKFGTYRGTWYRGVPPSCQSIVSSLLSTGI